MKSDRQRSLFDSGDESIEAAHAPAIQQQWTRTLEEGVAPEPSLPAAASSQNCVASEVPEDCEWVSFLRSHRRVPHIGDDKKPWEYRGWLMYYRLLLEDHLDIPKRWDYWYRTMAAGHLLDEPIPKIRFGGVDSGGRSEGHKLIDQWIRLVERFGEGWSSPMTLLLDWLLWGFGLSAERPAVTPQLNEQLYRAVNIGPMVLHPYDYFGEWIALQKGHWNPNAFYPTPHEVVELMVEINFSV